ncbi:probable PRO3-delta 1-pyrroline-5-carboxylate reductase [Ustilago bromivora]|uniref:Pyrroline-5-carboxylate reductase n=1 Tax=Ustilago bromivora TaxID=307758 RepID=A0A1K0FVH3_9BASI|nr:probable PRO3-delta 1-pyrroline-5-carboxylate reductase [Ustilago bromivora]SYW75423.1 probable PRO3 - delta 1-pyrroline-5-carboxylate reductase [Ustilago bromivora]
MPGYTLAVIGCGTMGVAILSGVLDSQRSQQAQAAASMASPVSSLHDSSAGDDLTELPNRYIATVNRVESVRRLKKTFAHYPDIEIHAGKNVQAARDADVILLGCKPQMVQDIIAEEGIKEALDGKLVISICAGLRISQMTEWVTPKTKVVRAMPNTPCKIREGMTILTPLSPNLPNAELDRSILLSIFSAVGKSRFLDEKHFDACTALAGSGPAFACVFLEAMADGGVMMGLPRTEALELAAQTMQGAARMVMQSGMHPAAIKDSVTTPGGCTIAGLLNLEDGKVRSTVARTIQAAAEHASGLGQTKK